MGSLIIIFEVLVEYWFFIFINGKMSCRFIYIFMVCLEDSGFIVVVREGFIGEFIKSYVNKIWM